MGAGGAGSGSRGRPRDSARDAAILEAAITLLVEAGYDRLTMEAVAARAGVAKTTVYRRWPDKAALVAAAVEHRAPVEAPVRTADDVRSAALEVASGLARTMAAQEAGLLGAVLAARRDDPELAAALGAMLRRDGAAMSAPLKAAAERGGEPLADDAGPLLAELLPALVLHRVLVVGEEPDDAFVRHLVDRVLLPLVQPGRPDRTGPELLRDR